MHRLRFALLAAIILALVAVVVIFVLPAVFNTGDVNPVGLLPTTVAQLPTDSPTPRPTTIAVPTTFSLPTVNAAAGETVPAMTPMPAAAASRKETTIVTPILVAQLTTPVVQATVIVPATPTLEPAPTFVPADLRSNCAYMFKSGDTLYAVALRSSTTVAELLRVNSINNANSVAVGQTLKLPNCETQKIEDATELQVPVRIDGESWAPEVGPGSFDLDTTGPDLVGLVFGVHVDWPDGHLDAGPEGCNFVVLTPGFYNNLRVKDGRYEMYRLPKKDQNGWITTLVEQRAAEQKGHYGCDGSTAHVQVWSADPHMTTWAQRRQASGTDYLIPFSAGANVFGYYIQLANGSFCDGGNCRLTKAPTDGYVGGGWVNSWWPAEAAQANAVPDWNPSANRVHQ